MWSGLTLTPPSRQAALPGPQKEGCAPGPTGRLSIQQRSHSLRRMSSVRETACRASRPAGSPRGRHRQHQEHLGPSIPDVQVVAQEDPVRSPLPRPKYLPLPAWLQAPLRDFPGRTLWGRLSHRPSSIWLPRPCPEAPVTCKEESLLGSPSQHLASLTEEPQAVTRVGAPKKLVQDGDLLREVDPVISWRCLRTNAASWEQGRLLGGRGI